MSTKFQVQFASGEKEFLSTYGVNLGFTSVHSKVARCYFLSSDAKQLYINLSLYAWDGKRECHPGQETLRTELGWGKNKITKYLDELREAGMIKTEKMVGLPLKYILTELQNVPILYHSEIVHEIRKTIFTDRNDFGDALEAYKSSSLFKLVSQKGNPEIYREEIEHWFYTWCVEHDSSTLDDEEVVDEEPKMEDIRHSNPLPTPIKVAGEVERVQDIETNRKKKVPRNYREAPVDDWNTNHFMAYFREKYRERYPTSIYDGTLDEQKHMKRILEQKSDKRIVKEHIDRFFDLAIFMPKTVRLFASHNTQAILDEYASTGKLPWWAGKKDKPVLKPDNEDYSF